MFSGGVQNANHLLVQLLSTLHNANGKVPVYKREGGSIPIVSNFNQVLNPPVGLMGFGLPDENLHAPNEHFNLENFDKGILTICSFLDLI
jgi:acetylornithine deacetylase/succinyl-diaminopimelate desuccinylase-like protein